MSSPIPPHTVYVPGKPIVEQLEFLPQTEPKESYLYEMPFEVSVANFKPLEIKGKLFNISMIQTSVIAMATEKITLGCDSYTFSVKSQDDDVNIKNISVDDIDATLAKLFESNVGAYATGSSH
jgi:hypothetical protein